MTNGRSERGRSPPAARRLGISNRPQSREDARPKKVSPMRAGKASGRQAQRRRAS